MENYMVINGKKIEISKETADNLEREFNPKNRIDIEEGDFKIETIDFGCRLDFRGDTILKMFSKKSTRDSKDSFYIGTFLNPVDERYKIKFEGNDIYLKRK